MARSNGNQDRTGQPGRPARAAQAQAVDHGLPWNGQTAPGAYQQDPQFAAPNFDPAQAGRPPAPPPPGQLPWPQAMPQHQPQGYAQHGYPNQAGHAYAQPAHPQPNYQQPDGYAAEPQHGHYFPQAEAQSHPAGANTYVDPAAQLRGSYPGHAEQGYPPHYGSHPGQFPAPQDMRGQDPRSYEFGAYATPAPSYPDPATGRNPTLPPGFAAPYPQQPQQQQFNPAYATAPAAAAAHEGDFEDDEEYEDEEADAPRRFGLVKIIASLTVAIGIGAGGAYGYKKFLAAPTNGKPMVARADVAPVRVGGSPTGTADSKTGDRLGENLPAVVPSNDGNAEGGAPAGARRVQTIAIAPPGSPGAGASQPNQPPMRPTISVPGLTIEGPALNSATAPQAASPFPPLTPAPVGRAAAPPPTAPRAPVVPKVIASAEEPPPAAPQRVAVAKAVPKASKASDAFTPGAPSQVGAPPQVGAAGVVNAAVAPATAAKVAPNGYVAVLASKTSAIDARKTLDELQGKYTEVLGSKPTDVTEFANPKDGATYYRAIVGPPGSREAAAQVCSQIRAAGHKDCFATAY